ncbi:MAG: NUDIX domain-containing protein [Anaerolineae bacterium]|nr:NUDIX domain-containing protein [Anaerolineae bacterium]
MGGETIRQAAQRELEEECGLKVHPGQVLDVIDAIYRDEEGKVRYHYVLIDLVAEYLNGELAAGSDIEEARWITKEELPEFHLPEKTLAVILKALEK